VAREVRRFAVTVPLGTAKATPQVSALAMPPRSVRWVEVKTPPGPHGLVGFQLASGGVQMVPINAGQFVTPDGETIRWDLEGQIDSGAWQMIAYNTGSFDHTLEVRFGCDLVAAVSVGTLPQAIDPALLLG